ncbi:MAG: class II aldolase/adducin family protein [Neomegalonema sp.]|nr:class II aldolase/adducin family protein [Neomegalonema sp.]
MTDPETALRRAIIDQCRAMNANGLNQGTSGNISVRLQGRMLITPSATPYDAMTPEMIAAMPLEGAYGAWEGPLKPSTEWRFHLDILKSRPEVNAIVHTHATYCTALAIARKEIPAAHYMIAAFGGATIRCSDYATYGTAALSETALRALDGRMGCLLANHGMIALGESLDKAMWRAVELETLAKQYYLTLAIGGPVLLSDAQIAETAAGFSSYGLQEAQTEDSSASVKPPSVKPPSAKPPSAKPKKRAAKRT